MDISDLKKSKNYFSRILLKFSQTKKNPWGHVWIFKKLNKKNLPQRYFKKLQKILKTFKHNPHGYFWKFKNIDKMFQTYSSWSFLKFKKKNIFLKDISEFFKNVYFLKLKKNLKHFPFEISNNFLMYFLRIYVLDTSFLT